MGTARWDMFSGGVLYASGNHTSSTTASNLTDGAAGAGSAVTAPVGAILTITCDEIARVVIGSGAATATSGILLQPDIAREIPIKASGTISVIDEA